MPVPWSHRNVRVHERRKVPPELRVASLGVAQARRRAISRSPDGRIVSHAFCGVAHMAKIGGKPKCAHWIQQKSLGPIPAELHRTAASEHDPDSQKTVESGGESTAPTHALDSTETTETDHTRQSRK